MITDEPIVITHIFRGSYFEWMQDGLDSGHLALSYDPGAGLICICDGIGREFVRKSLYALADHIADHAKMENV